MAVKHVLVKYGSATVDATTHHISDENTVTQTADAIAAELASGAITVVDSVTGTGYIYPATRVIKVEVSLA